MKKLLILVSIFAIAACSSKEKEEEQMAPAPTPTVQEENKDADTSATDEASDASSQDDSKESMAMDSGSNMEGGFPDVEGTERSGATCKNGGDERLVSVIDTREGPCGVVYTKNGNKNTVAYAKYDMSFCDKVFDNIVGNLTSGGFDCGGAGNTASGNSGEQTEEAAEEKSEGDQ